ncbi:DNA-processing protein DprA [Limoniibacter endophyticus]|uniref:DNA processing protein DprA n=1 Tax=Limoniibacter endophyticus TaxID=1565040 RepID=A0A8J3DM32_9HYPH|nr:DNA-processing protein DprA [Limoniibacter endophyticus]GHC62307.1 DNA processing protein DprA [Limoniibacter endophyticus]
MSDRRGRPELTDQQRLSWLRLIRTPNIGPATFRDLINAYGSADAALEALPDLARQGGNTKPFRVTTQAQAEREMDFARDTGIRLVAIGERDYPKYLRAIDHPPPLLGIKGDPSVFTMPPVAIVGARNASIAGTKFARQIAAELASADFCIVSGLARGIDTAAHLGSLQSGTIAALAGGIDRPYPPQNFDLAQDITKRGMLVSEMPLGWEPRAQDFPRRNRLIAGISLGLVVVEATHKSGSLISARLAGEMGRLVFAVPGSPLDPRSGGTNRLLRDGASIVCETRDIVEALLPMIDNPPVIPPLAYEPPDLSTVSPPGDSERSAVVEALGAIPTPVDEIVRHTGIAPAKIHLILLELEIAGRLERHPGNRVSLHSF